MSRLIRTLLIWLHIIDRPGFIGRHMITHPHPNDLEAGVLIVVRDGAIKKWVCFRCPGGCGEKIMLPLSETRWPHWTVTFDWLGRPTLSPSIRQTNECKCHFWIRRGKVEWCLDTGRPFRGPGRSVNPPTSP